MIDSHSFGYVSGTERTSLSGSFTPNSTGLYTLHIENERDDYSTPLLFNYIDNISLAPAVTDFHVDTLNIQCATGGQASFALNAGPSHGGDGYWIWMSASGTWPGIKTNNVTVPLNWDAVLLFGLYYPDFPGSNGFLGNLNGNGKATASLIFPADPLQVMKGVPLNFGYVLTSPNTPVQVFYASFPVLLKYVP